MPCARMDSMMSSMRPGRSAPAICTSVRPRSASLNTVTFGRAAVPPMSSTTAAISISVVRSLSYRSPPAAPIPCPSPDSPSACRSRASAISAAPSAASARSESTRSASARSATLARRCSRKLLPPTTPLPLPESVADQPDPPAPLPSASAATPPLPAPAPTVALPPDRLVSTTSCTTSRVVLRRELATSDRYVTQTTSTMSTHSSLKRVGIMVYVTMCTKGHSFHPARIICQKLSRMSATMRFGESRRSSPMPKKKTQL
mmetsp:Transcript_30919/g.77451  ORF Transcript_30919/g.77451 Transcript_30919/m.77451 type:complete len:259 (+) Transcript_30919:1117-1893(+)